MIFMPSFLLILLSFVDTLPSWLDIKAEMKPVAPTLKSNEIGGVSDALPSGN